MGFRVRIPARTLCRGRPLYDCGVLTTAGRYPENTVDALTEKIRTGVPVVELEPYCVAVFHDELLNMMPNDENARRLCTET